MKNQKLYFYTIVALILSGLFVVLPFSASSFCVDKPVQIINAYKNRYIVELSLPSVAERDYNKLNLLELSSSYHSYLSSFQRTLMNRWEAQHLVSNTLGQLFYLSNAIIIEPSSLEALNRIKQQPEVEGIYSVNEYYLQRNISVPSVHAPEVWKKTDKDGRFIQGNQMIVGVIDSGIEYWHGDFGCGIGKKPDGSFYKIMKGYDFSEMNPISYDQGISFHGTHVSGIIAGYGEAGIASGDQIGKGVAPEASLISYKVFTNNRKSTGSDAILLALDQAIQDKCNVINLSLGRFFGWSDDYLSLACQKISETGIIVVASAGNDGDRDNWSNLYPISTPSSGKDVISVASVDETIKYGFAFTVEDKHYQYPGRLFLHCPSFPEQSFQLVFLNGEGLEADYNEADVNGKVVIAKRGGSTFAEKNTIAKKHGASGLIIYNYSKGWFQGFLNKDSENIPTLSISNEAGQAIKRILENNPGLSVQFTPELRCTVMSDFSSQGPTPEGNFKPEISAPGTNILSATVYGGYTYASGTSMAAPHVSGAAALLKQFYPDYSVSDIRSLLINYSDIVFNPYTQKPYSWLKQGAGKLNILKSIEGPVTIEPATLVLPPLDKSACKTEYSFSFQCTNKSNKPIHIAWKMEASYLGEAVGFDFQEEAVTLEPKESRKMLIDFSVVNDSFLEKEEQWIEWSITGKVGDSVSFHIPGLLPLKPPKEMDHNPISYFFPNLAISPNYDGNNDSNTFYFLSTYITDGYQIDIWDDTMKKRIGILDYGIFTNGAGYFQLPIDGDVQGMALDDGFYSVVPYLLPKGADRFQQENWKQGKYTKLLVDRVPPLMSLSVHFDPEMNEIKASGKITDNHPEFGLFLMLELDYDEADLVDVNDDGTFSCSLKPESEYGFITFTAQDIAGNTYRIKKRLY